LVNRRRQAYRQAPWRLEIRTTSGTALLLIVMLVVGGLYLAVNARLAEAGRSVLTLEDQRRELQRMKAERTANLAQMLSPERLYAQASQLGFRPAGPGDVDYVEVEGYVGPQAFIAPRPPAIRESASSRFSPAYTETLGPWLMRWIGGTGASR
jgi:hypothetical protein